MDNGDKSLTYFVLLNNPATKQGYPIPIKEKVTMKIELSWKLYLGPPDFDIAKKFPNIGQPEADIRTTIGWDEFEHTRWSKDDPAIKAKEDASGKIEGTMTWTGAGVGTFDSPNELPKGPNRKDRGEAYYPENEGGVGWEFKDGKWQQFTK